MPLAWRITCAWRRETEESGTAPSQLASRPMLLMGPPSSQRVPALGPSSATSTMARPKTGELVEPFAALGTLRVSSLSASAAAAVVCPFPVEAARSTR